MTSATYDGDGVRTSTTTNSGGTQHYAWDVSSSSDPQLLMNSGNAYVYNGYGVPVEQVPLTFGAVTYLIADAPGSGLST